MPYSDDWQTYGNSIGNGSIIKVLPADGRPCKQLGKKPQKQPDSLEFIGGNQATVPVAPKLLPDPVQAPKPKLMEPMFRGISPIKYDLRGRRIKDPAKEE